MKAIYVIAEEGSANLKIGYAANPRLRIANMRVGVPRHLSIVYSVFCERAEDVERCVHDLLAAQRVRGEWFSATEQEARAAIAYAIAKLRVATREETGGQEYKPADGRLNRDRAEKHRWYVREWLAFRGLTQEHLARSLGVDGGDISKWITGKRRYNEDVLEGFASALGVTPAELLGTNPFAVAEVAA